MDGPLLRPAGHVGRGRWLGGDPAAPGSIPPQLVKANPATGAQGAMTGTAYIQRVATMGGVAPSRA